jgi:hypothetical protein
VGPERRQAGASLEGNMKNQKRKLGACERKEAKGQKKRKT